MSENRNPRIGEQYRNWVYPEPIEDLNAWRGAGNYVIADPGREFHYYWPHREKEPLTILVAGCGTHQAAATAFVNRDFKVVGIDISEASLRHTRNLKDRHELDNLEIIELDLNEVGRLNREFDLVFSTGVLHHLPDPVAGGRALAEVLAPDGIMSLMLYGTTLRVGVYLLQEAFRAIGLEQTRADVDLMKAMLAGLPEDHAVQRYRKRSVDWNSDSGLVDTLLNPQDRAYSVSDVYEFADQLGLKFRNWADNGTLALDHYLLPNFPGYDRIKALPLRQQEVFVDSFFQVTGTHRFNLCRPGATGYEIDFSDDGWKSWRPVRRFNLRFQKLSEPEKGPIAVWARNRNVFGANLFCHALLEAMNGENTSAQCIAEAKSRLPVHPEDPEKHTRDFLSDMWQRGHIYFCKV